MTRMSLSILIIILLTLGTFSTLVGHQNIGNTTPAKNRQAGPSRSPTLGIDCGLGTREAVLNGTGFPVASSENGAFGTKSSCTWIGDVALTGGGIGDSTNEPLVADQDEAFSTVSSTIGGGFTANVVYLQNGTSRFSGFDVSVTWNPNILHAELIDQGGTDWGAMSPFTAVKKIDNSVGLLRLVQVVFVTLGGNFTLFRIRFDVVGVGSTGLTFVNDQIVNPGLVVHQASSGSFDSESFYDPGHTLNWSATFTNSTPLNVGGENNFAASVSGGSSPYTYAWMFNGTSTTPFVAQNSSTTSSVSRTMPVDNTVSGNRIRLRITDSATPASHTVEVVQLLPFTSRIQGPTTIPVNSPGTWSALWLGGLPNYSVKWRFCPGTASSTAVCSVPVASISSQASQSNTETLTGYHFSGIYNVSTQVSTSGTGSLGTNTLTKSFLLNVTGGTPVFTVPVNPDQNSGAGVPTHISASVVYSPSYPVNSLGVSLRSNQFAYTFTFGDGTQPTVVTAGLNASISHTFASMGSYPITVIARDTQTPSQIQERGFATINVGPAPSFDYSLSLNPSQGAVGSGGGTTSSLVIVNMVAGIPQTVSLHAASPSPGITISFNRTSGLPAFASAMNVSVSPSTSAGTYNIIVIGNTTSGLSRQAVFQLFVMVPPSSSPIIVGVFSKDYLSSNITDTKLVVGSTFSVQVNVTNAPPFNGFEFALFFDQNYIHLSSYTYDSRSVLCGSCVFDNPYNTPGSFNDSGAIRLSVVNLATATNNHGLFSGGSGTLANLVFSVVKVGVSPLTLAAGMTYTSPAARPPGAICPQCPAGAADWTRLVNGHNLTVYGPRTIDGYFKNIAGKFGPVASFTFLPPIPDLGSTVTFDASNSFDPDNSGTYNHGIIEYSWDFGDASDQANLTSFSPTVTHRFSIFGNNFVGNFSIRLTVIDLDNGFQGMVTMRLLIAPPPNDESPTASFTFKPQTPLVNQVVYFDGGASLDPDGSITMWSWSFGDGINETDRSPTTAHVYAVPGNHTVTLTVTDISGLKGSISLDIKVLSAPPHDVAIATVRLAPSVAIAGQPIMFEAAVINTGSNPSIVNLTFYYNGLVAVSQTGIVVPVSPYGFFVSLQWDTTGIPPGTYQTSATVFLPGDPTPGDNSIMGGELILLSPPTLTLSPTSGPVGTLVTVHGSNFLLPPQFIQVQIEMTFDNQLVGIFYPTNSSFDFSFNVPVSEPNRVHQVHALELYPFNLDIQAPFTVTPSPVPINVNVSVGTIYFPGDTATIFISTSLNGQFTNVQTIQVSLIRPGATNLTLPALSTSIGVYKATYTVPSTGTVIGTYAIIVKAHLTGSIDSTALASFEVKPTWLSSNKTGITASVAITGLVGLAAFAWRRGYFRKNEEEPTPF